MQKFISRIPRECVDRILSYSYNPQPRDLMCEVRAAAKKRELIDTWFSHIVEFYGDRENINIIIFNYIKVFVITHYDGDVDFISKLTKLYKNNKNRRDAIHRMCSIFSCSQVIEIMDDFDYYVMLYYYSYNRYNPQTRNLPSWLQCPCGAFMCIRGDVRLRLSSPPSSGPCSAKDFSKDH